MSSQSVNEWRILRDALVSSFASNGSESSDVAAEIALVTRYLEPTLQVPPIIPVSSGHGVTRYLDEVLASTETFAPAFAKALKPVAAALPWRYGYLPRDDAPGLESEMAWAELIGPVAPWRSDDVCLGLTLIGRNSFYPAHRHPAVELYTVVSGTAEWSLGNNAAWRPPGSRILHLSEAVHAMRTGDEPLLAIYSWTGDVISPSRYISEAAGGAPVFHSPEESLLGNSSPVLSSTG